MNEEQLATEAMAWLQVQGWDCYPEVVGRFSGRPDIVAVRGPLTMVVECKIKATMSLWAQAASWIGWAHFVCVCFPYRKVPHSMAGFQLWLENNLGVGKMEYRVRFGRTVFEPNRLPTYRRPNKVLHARLRESLHPDQKNYTPGTASGRYSSPWRRTMDAAVRYVQSHEGCTIHELIDALDHHYATDKSARACIGNWLPKEDGIRSVHDGKVWRYHVDS